MTSVGEAAFLVAHGVIREQLSDRPGGSAMTAAPSDRRAIITEALRKIDDLTARLHIAEKGDTEPIAVVGMGCRLPGGVDNPGQFWRLLQDGVSGIVRVPPERWDADAFYSDDHTRPGTICNREGGFLTSWRPDEFDAEFFGISPREAVGMDPQQRVLLEVSWEALESAGIDPFSVYQSSTGVYIGISSHDYAQLQLRAGGIEKIDPHFASGAAQSVAAGRISYVLGLNGPSLAIDTACSSSLVAVHLACEALRRGECNAALAGGVNLILSPEPSIAFAQAGMLSEEGKVRAFSSGADGFVRGEGCGVLLLKRLSGARSGGDRIFGLLL